MKDDLVTREELIGQAGVSEKVLADWEAWRIIKPSGFSDDHVPFYNAEAIERIRQIKHLLALGYGIEEIQKIIKKVGLPKSGSEKEKKASPQKFLTVGNLAIRVGVSTRTIKHWEDQGIIEPDMRSKGGFRFYSEIYVYLCKLIKDLQLFGYSLGEINVISDLFRDFLAIAGNLNVFNKQETAVRIEKMIEKIDILLAKVAMFEEGIERWRGLLKKKKKEILVLKNRNQKREEGYAGRRKE